MTTTRLVAAIGLFSCLVNSGLHAQWVQRKPTVAPDARANPGMVFDTDRGRVVMFGGRDPAKGKNFDDTWEWDGSSWKSIVVSTRPSGRHAHMMAYDSARKRTVLFGGGPIGGPRRGDTWEFDGSTWTNVTPSMGSPKPNGIASMVFDADRKRVLLFGGTTGARTYVNETWQWDGKTWKKLSPATSPSVRAYLPIVYDTLRKTALIFGGTQGTGALSDTWEWSGTNWTQAKPTASPPKRGGHSMAFDTHRNKAVLFGGVSWPSTIYPGQTWEWDGKTWTQVKVAPVPAGRWGASMVYDSKRHRVVLFGGTSRFDGQGVFGDTWEYGPWASFSTFGRGCASTTTLPTISGSPPKLGQKTTLEIKGFRPKPQFGQLIFGVSNTRWGIIPLPLDLAVLNMGNCMLWVSMDSSNLFVTDSQGNFKTTFTVPSSGSILGTKVYGQAWAPDSNSNGLGIAMTNAFLGIVGY